jgi:transcriptional regulator with XRE-family HTH domain
MSDDPKVVDVRLAAFGSALLEVRTSLRLSQTDIARDLNVTQSAVSGWESGKYAPGPAEVFALEVRLGLAPGALSHTLGFLPLGKSTQCTVETAVAADERLTDHHRAVVLACYRTLTQVS